MNDRSSLVKVPPVTGGPDGYRAAIAKLAENTAPTFFHLAAQLPRQGRTDTIFAASDLMTVILKTYAVSGENDLHRHPAEDHAFFVLEGEAEFYGPKGEVRRIGRYDGVFLPDTAYYCFKAVGEEPLVLLRVGARKGEDAGITERADVDENVSIPTYKGQTSVETILYEDRFFG